MNIKSILFWAIVFCFVCPAGLSAQVRYGLKAGVVLADMPFNDADQFFYHYVILQKGARPRMTFFAGGVAELDLRRNWTLSAELQLTGKGSLEQASDAFQNFEDYAARLWYVQLPVAGNFRWNGFFVGAGPYAGIGLAGKTKTTRTDPTANVTVVDKQTVTFGNDEDADFRRFDAGLYTQAGYSFRNFRLSLAGYFGLVNTIPEFYAVFDRRTARHQSISIAAAYYFGVGE